MVFFKCCPASCVLVVLVDLCLSQGILRKKKNCFAVYKCLCYRYTCTAASTAFPLKSVAILQTFMVTSLLFSVWKIIFSTLLSSQCTFDLILSCLN